MKNTCLTVVVAMMVLAGWSAEAERLKVLMIGNSFSVQMVNSLPPIAKDLGLKVDICSLYIGGCSLQRHWENICSPTSRPYRVTRSVDGVQRKEFMGNISQVLGGERWDVVTLQQASHFSWKPETYHPWGDKLVKYIRETAPNAKILVQGHGVTRRGTLVLRSGASTRT